MPKIIAVTGATGAQGGGVVNVMSKTPGWEVRAITRNVKSDAAQKLAAKGAQVVSASYDDEEALARAFEVSARFRAAGRGISGCNITDQTRRASAPCLP
jgi:uncharacterized protein YbjT (DUF2867 family)